MRGLLRKLWRETVWHPDAIPLHEGEMARDVKRWVLPPLDALLIAGSALALGGGMPSLAIVYNATVSDIAAVLVLVSSIACLAGVSFPRLWLLEMCAKLSLIFVLVVYAMLLFGLSFTGTGARGFTAGVTAACSVLPLWRIVWLGREWRRRRGRA